MIVNDQKIQTPEDFYSIVDKILKGNTEWYIKFVLSEYFVMAIWADSHPHNKYCQNTLPTFYKTVNFSLKKQDMNYKNYFKAWYPHCASRIHSTRRNMVHQCTILL